MITELTVENELVTKTPLDYKQIQSWIRTPESDGRESLETRFFTALTEFADLLGEGRQGPEGQFTGRNFCDLSSAIFLQALKHKFGPDIDAQIVSKEIPLPSDKKGRVELYPHTYIRFKGTDGEIYFLDPTYGQMNERLNRIAIDKAANEEAYYGIAAFSRGERITTEYGENLLQTTPQDLLKWVTLFPKRLKYSTLMEKYNNLLQAFN